MPETPTFELGDDDLLAGIRSYWEAADPLPAGMVWPGKGLLEVVTSEDELVYVDGVFTGRGPLRRVPVAPGAHEISIRKEGSERHGTADVEPGRTTRALFQRK